MKDLEANAEGKFWGLYQLQWSCRPAKVMHGWVTACQEIDSVYVDPHPLCIALYDCLSALVPWPYVGAWVSMLLYRLPPMSLPNESFTGVERWKKGNEMLHSFAAAGCPGVDAGSGPCSFDPD